MTLNDDSVQTPQPIRRLVTDHDAKGKAVFTYEGHVTAKEYIEPNGKVAKFTVPWMTDGFPIDNQTSADGAATVAGELTKSDGSVIRIVDFPPGALSPMHRTESLDYGIVIYGTLELELDDGEKRTIKQSDVVVQQGTIHAWRNLSDGYARMVFVLLSAKPIQIDGKPLGDVSIH